MTTEPTLAEWQRIYAAYAQSLPTRRFTMQHGRPGRWPDDEFGPDRGPEPDDPAPIDLLDRFMAGRRENV